MDFCPFGSVRPSFTGYLRIALLWLVQLGAYAQHGRWMEDLFYSQSYGFYHLLWLDLTYKTLLSLAFRIKRDVKSQKSHICSFQQLIL